MTVPISARSRTSRLAGAALAASIALGLLIGVTATFHDAKATQVAKAETARHYALKSGR